MKEEKEEVTIEELKEQIEVLEAENESLKERIEEVPAGIVEEVEEETEETTETLEEALEEAPAPENDRETALQTRLEALWQREVQIELKEAGLEAFGDFIQVEVDNDEDLQAKVKALQTLLEEYEVEDTYQPTNHTNTDAYALAKAKKDPKAMLKARFG